MVETLAAPDVELGAAVVLALEAVDVAGVGAGAAGPLKLRTSLNTRGA